jgi:N-acyl-L-homoserine lactone synthetase
MEPSPTPATEPPHGLQVPGFHTRAFSDDAGLLDRSFRLRYQVYCVERHYLNADDYPDKRETDEFDGHSVHVGAIDACGELAGTARLIKTNPRGFPMFQHCAFFPEMQTLRQPGTVPVEVSRVSISRHYVRPRDRRYRKEPFLTLVKAIMQGAKRAGATHLIGATDAAFHRWLVHNGLPYRVAGPEVDYYGPVAPCIMSLHELDAAILSGRYASLEGFPVGWDPRLWPGQGEFAVNPPASVASVTGTGWQPYHP